MSSSTNAGEKSNPLDRFSKILTDEDRRKILRNRAQALAQKEQENLIAASDVMYVFEFMLAGERYAFDTKFVREVLSAKNVATVPCTPRFISGVLNVRGEIITILDTKRLFEFPSNGIEPTSKIIIVSDGATQMGFFVDSVIGIAEINKTELQQSLPTISAQQARYILGITSTPLIIIDLDMLMHDPGIVVDEEVE